MRKGAARGTEIEKLSERRLSNRAEVVVEVEVVIVVVVVLVVVVAWWWWWW